MAAFDVQDFIDHRKVSATHVAVLALGMAMMFVDGLDVFMVGKIAPAIAKGYGRPTSAMTTVFLMQQIGLAVGAFVTTPMADRFGRKRMMLVSAAAFGALTLATVLAQSLLQLAILRGVAGLFLSGMVPMAMSLVAEASPAKRRGTFIALALIGYTGGGAAGGAIAAWLIDDYGWRSAFWIAGLLPLACVPLMWLLVPESLQYMVSRNPGDPRIPRAVLRFAPELVLTGSEAFVVGDGSKRADKAGLLDIFRDGRARTTTILWLCCLLSMGNIALLASWMPSFFQEMAGVPIQRFAVTAMISFVGGLAGTLTMGWLLDRVRPSRLIPAYYLGNAAALVSLGVIPFASPAFLGLLTVWSLFQTGGQFGINALMTRIYPASARSTGVGWAGGAGRIGGIIAPLFGGFALASNMSLQQTMLLIALPSVAVALMLTLLVPVRPATEPVAA